MPVAVMPLRRHDYFGVISEFMKRTAEVVAFAKRPVLPAQSTNADDVLVCHFPCRLLFGCS
jgi:hypothetical protein